MTEIDQAPAKVVFENTELGNAKYFAYLMGETILWDKRAGSWVYWEDGRWNLDTSGYATFRFGQVAEARSKEAMGHVRVALQQGREADPGWVKTVRWALSSQSAGVIRNSLDLAKTLPFMTCTDWDEDGMMTGVGNGVVNLVTGGWRRQTQADRVLFKCGVEYDSQATAPRWDKFLREVFVDEDVIDYVQRAVGYTLSGSTRHHVLFYCLGTGANGKTTFMNVLRHLMGEYHGEAQFNTFLKGRGDQTFDLAMLRGKRLVTAAEPPLRAHWDESRVKSITGGEPITAAHKYGHPFTFTPRFKIWVAANHFVDTDDHTEGFWRRIVPINFPNHFEIDGRVEPWLLSELPGILNWAIQGALMWQEQGLAMPQVMYELQSSFKKEQLENTRGNVAQFRQERLEEDVEGRMSSTELYREYQGWCEFNMIMQKDRLSPVAFGRQLSAQGVLSKRASTGTMYRAKLKGSKPMIDTGEPYAG